MCAITAGQCGRRVLLLEHNREPGAKILISGGGRCNFTNLEVAPENFLSANPHFCKSALSRYTQHDFHRARRTPSHPLHEKTLGQLFCDGSAREILAMLLAECKAARVDLRTGHSVTEISRNDRFRIETNCGGFIAQALVIATGGLSIPKMGATGFAYDAARRFGSRDDRAAAGTGAAQGRGRDARPDASRWPASRSTRLFRAAAKLPREHPVHPSRPCRVRRFFRFHLTGAQGDALSLDLAPAMDVESFLKDRKRTRPKAELEDRARRDPAGAPRAGYSRVRDG